MWAFSVTKEHEDKISEWLKNEIHPGVLAVQKTDPMLSAMIYTDSEGNEWPYDGVCGGNLTYEFTPTSLGNCLTVRHFSGAKLDLTDYESW